MKIIDYQYGYYGACRNQIIVDKWADAIGRIF